MSISQFKRKQDLLNLYRNNLKSLKEEVLSPISTEKGGSCLVYCEKCSRLYEEEKNACDECNHSLREPKENDPVLVYTGGIVFANMVEPLFKDMGIVYVKESNLGIGFTMWAGAVLETYRFLVPFGIYPAARELLESTFGEDPVLMEGIR